MKDMSGLWDEEFRKGGIPCTKRESPSTTLRWFLANAKFVRPENPLARVIDLGCGTGRNAAFLADQGISVLGIDSSAKAIEMAEALVKLRETAGNPGFDVRRGRIDQRNEFLRDSSFDGAIDIFVSKHLVSPLERERYKLELDRILAPGALFFISLAAVDDGYYSQLLPGGALSGERVVTDPVSGISSKLFSREEVIEEFRPMEILAFWDKQGKSKMYGEEYDRHVLAFIFQK
ncbi:MAG: class I SAM-dependent methyltransferase [Planctomycetes bacterium]|nr:class I SAM-dependent methyltransferase [Planctomycetota bacterium]